jgi:hypothetical protein
LSVQQAYYKNEHRHDEQLHSAQSGGNGAPVHPHGRPHAGHPYATERAPSLHDGMHRPSTLTNDVPTLDELAQYDTLEKLQSVFHLPINDAATALGMGVTVLKKLCRDRGIKRWPYRKLSSVDKLIESVKAVRACSQFLCSSHLPAFQFIGTDFKNSSRQRARGRLLLRLQRSRADILLSILAAQVERLFTAAMPSSCSTLDSKDSLISFSFYPNS